MSKIEDHGDKLVDRLGTALSSFLKRTSFDNSRDYWEQRYRHGGNSGAGSYNRLAEFKAQFINNFVAANSIKRVIEFGSGDGAQLALAQYPTYTGIDISETAIETTRIKFSSEPSMAFLHTSEVSGSEKGDLTLSLDVIYHLVEDDVFEVYMHQLFNASIKFVIVYASNEDKPWSAPHVRHREFTRWVKSNRSDFVLVQKVPNAYPYSKKDPMNTSFADFYVFERQF